MKHEFKYDEHGREVSMWYMGERFTSWCSAEEDGGSSCASDAERSCRDELLRRLSGIPEGYSIRREDGATCLYESGVCVARVDNDRLDERGLAAMAALYRAAAVEGL